jgi:hypothetical protein
VLPQLKFAVKARGNLWMLGSWPKLLGEQFLALNQQLVANQQLGS